MQRRRLIETLALGAGWMLWQSAHAEATATAAKSIDRLTKTKAEWRKLLDPRRYDILFEGGTERPFSSPLNDEKRPGTFVCAACYLPLFRSEDKYDSGTGWPSFTQPIAGAMGTKADWKILYLRTEYHCIRCSGHQGHVFDDGPKPTGQRWCNNGLALIFVPRGATLPALRS